MVDPTVTPAILAFIAFSIPIVGALWKLFAVRESLNAAIKQNLHRIEMMEQHVLHTHDKLELSLSSMREQAAHALERGARGEEKLLDRIYDLECYLTKTTDFNPRDRD